MRTTKASEALSARFSERHGAQKACSDSTGIAQSRLSRIASGTVFPRADESVKIERAEGIPCSWWDAPVGQGETDPEPPDSESKPDAKTKGAA